MNALFFFYFLRSNADAPAFQLPSSLPALADKAPIPKASNDEDSDLDDDVVVTEAPTHLPAAGPSKKRAAPDEASDEAEKGEASKKRRAEGGDGNGETDGKESNKKRRKGTGGEEHVIVLE